MTICVGSVIMSFCECLVAGANSCKCFLICRAEDGSQILSKDWACVFQYIL